MADVLQMVQHVCSDFFTHGKLPTAEVIRALISRVLGYGILAFSVIVKLPQVANVLKSRSADGLSAVSFELESWGLLVHTAYGYLKGLPFSTYGEASILFAQNILLLACVYKYGRFPSSRWLAALVVVASASTAVLTGHVSLELMTGAYDLNNLILMSARVPQIWKNFQNKSTGQLSIITYAANTLGCVARIFTTIQEGAGSAMLRSYCLSLVLNSIIVAQILVFGNRGVAARRTKPATKAA